LLVDGIGSDLQVFGYDEGPLKQADRVRSRRQRKATWWRLYRQELYVDQETEPFAIVEWKHTLNRISVVEIYSPPDRERKSVLPKLEYPISNRRAAEDLNELRSAPVRQ
jgi:hypothetical protein